MGRINWKAGNMIFPIPAALVSCGSSEDNYNLITVSWTGTVCTNPPICYISLRKERFSHEIITKEREFIINLSSEKMARATDWCGVKSGRDFDKFKECGFTAEKASIVKAPIVAESPVAIECKVMDIRELGSHDMFLAEVVSVSVDETFLNTETGAFDMQKAELIASSHGKYCGLKSPMGHFGYSVRKKKKKPGHKKAKHKKTGHSRR